MSTALQNSTMPKKSLIILVSTLSITILIILFWTANRAEQKSSEILNDFKAIDKSLTELNDSTLNKNDSVIKTLNGIGAVTKDSTNY